MRSTVISGDYGAAYMFSGPTGVGKTTLARVFSKAILCLSPKDGNPCGVCESCKSFDEEGHFGYMELDAASYGGKEDMVKLRDEAYFSSPSGKKVILLDECQDISRQGQDALLKQTENVPKHLIYMFCTTDPDSVKDTLHNRCTIFNVSRVPSEPIFNRLKMVCQKEAIQYDDNGLNYIVEVSDGHVRNSLKALEKSIMYGPITGENVQAVISNYDEEVCDLILSLGPDLAKALKIAANLSARMSALELYNKICVMVSDTVKYIYGYDDFIPRKKKLIEKLKDMHGFALVEFLDYLISRDKFIERVGIQSDIMLLHHKFCSGSFKPAVNQQSQPVSVQDSSVQEKPNALSHDQLIKLSSGEKGRVLREHRLQKVEEKSKDPERVPTEWPLPKEKKLGEDSSDDQELTPEEFSRLLVGGRGGG